MGHVQDRRRLAGEHSDQQVRLLTKALTRIFHNESARIFAIAIAISLAWHLFWISTVTIIAKPDKNAFVKFSKVSFLGPILGKGAMEVQARPKERSFLENRYLEAARSAASDLEENMIGGGRDYDVSPDLFHSRNESMSLLIDGALNAEKPQAGYGAD